MHSNYKLNGKVVNDFHYICNLTPRSRPRTNIRCYTMRAEWKSHLKLNAICRSIGRDECFYCWTIANGRKFYIYECAGDGGGRGDVNHFHN